MRFLPTCAAIVCVFSCAAVMAQGRATLAGTVKDPAGLVVSGAVVTLTNTGTRETQLARTNDSGSYDLLSVLPGSYELSVAAAGFETYVARGIILQVDENRTVAVTMVVGKRDDQVYVNADEGAQVDTRSSALVEVIDSRRVLELPLDGRNPLDLQGLVAGAGLESAGGSGQAQNNQISINGNRPNSNNYTLDGADNEDPFFNTPSVVPNPDALDQFSIRTSNYDATQGRNAGAQVDSIIKSGTNNIHGSAFEYLRNSVFDAYPYFKQSVVSSSGALVPGPKPPYKRNQFGGAVGFPILHNKLFEFLAYQGTRQRASPLTDNITVLSAAERGGDFSELCLYGLDATGTCKPIPSGSPTGTPAPIQLKKPGTTTKLPFNNLTPYLYAPMVAFLKAYVPFPNGAGNTYNFTPATEVNEDQYIARTDARLGQKDNLFGHYVYVDNNNVNNTDQLNIPGFLTSQHYINHHVSINETHVFTSNVLNVFTLGYERIHRVQSPITPDGRSLTDFGTGLVRAAPGSIPGYAFNVAALFHATTGFPLDQIRTAYQYSDLLNWSLGSHHLGLGGDLREENTDQTGTFRADAAVAFTLVGTGSALGDFLTGLPNAVTQQGPNGGDYRRLLPDLFINDDWKALPRLSLNLGIRWEPFRPLHDILGQVSAFRPGIQSTTFPLAPLGVVFPGDPGVEPDTYSAKWAVFSPRVGFAWNVYGDGKTAVRGAFGVYNSNIRETSLNNSSTNIPYDTKVAIARPSKGLAAPYADLGYIPFPYTPPTPSQYSTFKFPTLLTLADFAPGFRQSRIEQWNLNVQQQFPGEVLAMIAYVGNNGEHLFGTGDGNPAPYGTTPIDSRRLYAPAIGAITRMYSDGHSRYHSLQATFTRRYRKGFTVLANYTWSKSIDNASLDTDVYPNPFNHSFSRGLSDFDIRNSVAASFVWHLPEPGKARSALLRGVAGGWSVNGLMKLQSGSPFSVISGVAGSSATVGQVDFADRIGNITYFKSGSHASELNRYFDTTAFVNDAPGTFGNSGRNSLIGPGNENINVSFMKDVLTVEKVKMLFRAEAFNVLNHFNPGMPIPNLNQANVGKIITQRGQPRLLQVAVRIQF